MKIRASHLGTVKNHGSLSCNFNAKIFILASATKVHALCYFLAQYVTVTSP